MEIKPASVTSCFLKKLDTVKKKILLVNVIPTLVTNNNLLLQAKVWPVWSGSELCGLALSGSTLRVRV